jgi:hypothetical protein
MLQAFRYNSGRQTAGSRPVDLVVGASFDDDNVDAGERQLGPASPTHLQQHAHFTTPIPLGFGSVGDRAPRPAVAASPHSRGRLNVEGTVSLSLITTRRRVDDGDGEGATPRLDVANRLEHSLT